MPRIVHIGYLAGPRMYRLISLFAGAASWPSEASHEVLTCTPPRRSRALEAAWTELGARRFHWTPRFFGLEATVRVRSMGDVPALLHDDDALASMFEDRDTLQVVLHYSPTFSPDLPNLFASLLPALRQISQRDPELFRSKAVLQCDDFEAWTAGRFSALEAELVALVPNQIHVGEELATLVADRLPRPAGLNGLCLAPYAGGTAAPDARQPDDSAPLRAVYMGGLATDAPGSHRNYLPLLDALDAKGVSITLLVAPHQRSGALEVLAARRGWQLESVVASHQALVDELAAHDFGIAGFNVPSDAPDLVRQALGACNPNKLWEYMAGRLPVLVWNARNLHHRYEAANPGSSMLIEGEHFADLDVARLRALRRPTTCPLMHDQQPAFDAFLRRMAS